MAKKIKKRENKWLKCFKIDSGDYAEVFKTFVRIKGTNYDSVEGLDRAIKRNEDEIELFKEVKQVWLEEFINNEKQS